VATYTKYENGIQAMLAVQIIAYGTTDAWLVAIATDAPDVAADDELADATQIGSSNGYPGSNDMANNGTRSGGTVSVAASDIVWTASGGNLGASTTGRYFLTYDDTSTTDKLIAYHDYGTTFTVATGETMTWNVTTNILTAA
jgi:hypothetical protein